MVNSFTRTSTQTLAALDIGSSKVCCLIAHIDRNKKVEIIGSGYNESKGIKNGIVTDINEATLSVCNAVETAEQAANERINRVIINISGEKIAATTRNGIINLHKNRAINDSDIEKLIAKINSKLNIADNELIHCIPTNYRVDKGAPAKDPRNIFGETLSLDMLMGVYPAILYKNLYGVIENAHLEVAEKAFSAYASALACLVDDEKELGATVIDIGGGLTSMVTFKNGFPVNFSTIPLGGKNITNDIAWVLTTSFAHAEDLKIRHGFGFLISQDENETINVYPVGEEDDNSIRTIKKSELIEIITARLEEIFKMVKAKLDEQGLKDITNHRIVLTGGTSQLPGICNVASLILDKQVRIGIPRNIPNIPKNLYAPTFSTALGMLLFALNYNERKPAKTIGRPSADLGNFSKIFNWFKQNF